MTGRAPCVPGCTCRKHRIGPRPVCPDGCVCKRHNKIRKVDWDDPEARRLYQWTQTQARLAADPEGTREAQRESSRRWAAKNPYYTKFRITAADWAAMLKQQDGCCYLCRRPFDMANTNKSIHIDHDHACCPTGGKSCGRCIRGLACRSCNQGIGSFRDDPVRIRRVAENLRIAKARLTHL